MKYQKAFLKYLSICANVHIDTIEYALYYIAQFIQIEYGGLLFTHCMNG